MTFAFMTFSTPLLDLAAVLATARRYGYAAVEPRLDAQHAHGIEVACSAAERTAIRQTVERSGIALSCLATSCTFANPDTRAAMLRDALDRVALAADVGAPVLRVFGGAFSETLARETGYAGAVSGEWIQWEPYETHLPRELATLRAYVRAGVTGAAG